MRIGLPITLALLIVFSSSCTQEPEETSYPISDITLNHYQKLVLSPKLYRAYHYRDLYEGVLDFYLKKYRIPAIKNGTIKIEEISPMKDTATTTLFFEDSLLTKVQDSRRSTQYQYDDQRNLISDGVVKYSYTDGKLSSKEKQMTIHTFDWKDTCVLWEAKDKEGSYTTNSILCFNENDKIIRDYSSYVLKDKAITEEFLIQFDLDMIIAHDFVRTENKDTTVHHIVNYEINNLGLLGKSSTTVINGKGTFGTATYEIDYKYDLYSIDPLIIRKFEFVDSLERFEWRYTFNEQGYLIEFEQVGREEGNYKVIYE